MYFYLLFSIFIILSYFFLFILNIKTGLMLNFFLLVTSYIFFFIGIGFFSSNSTDYINYEYFFNFIVNNKSNLIFLLLNSGQDLGFTFLSYLFSFFSNDVGFFYVALSFLILLLVFYAFNKLGIKIFIFVIFLLFFSNFYFKYNNIIRTMFAVSILFPVITKEFSFKKNLLFLITASLVHISSLLFFIIFFTLKKSKFSSKLVYNINLIATFISPFLLLSSIYFFNPFFSLQGNLVTNIIIPLSISFLSSVILVFNNKQYKRNYFHIFNTALLFLLIMSLNFKLLERFSYYFYLSTFLVLFYQIHSLSIKSRQLLHFFLFFSSIILLFYFYIFPLL